jgi:hypothetical protein
VAGEYENMIMKYLGDVYDYTPYLEVNIITSNEAISPLKIYLVYANVNFIKIEFKGIIIFFNCFRV